MRTLLPVLALTPALLLFGCNDDDDDSDQPPATADASSQPATPTPGVETPSATAGGFQGGTTAVEVAAPPGLQQARLVNVRAAAQDGFDRLVFEFAGNQVPGYSVKYVTSVTACGSGQDLTNFVGDGKVPAGLLLVTLRPAAAHDDNGELTAARALTPGLSSLKNVFGTCDFEGVVAYAVALSGQKPFKVSVLQSPPRLVIDIAQ